MEGAGLAGRGPVAEVTFLSWCTGKGLWVGLTYQVDHNLSLSCSGQFQWAGTMARHGKREVAFQFAGLCSCPEGPRGS